MYIPKQYRGKDKNEAIAFMRKYNFGIIVSSNEKRPIATHLPFAVLEREDQLILVSHFAKANEQWQQLNGQEILVIFSEPHAYISPRFYNKKENVPTWNYLSVHAYGKIKLVQTESATMEVLKLMIQAFESSYEKQWEELPDVYKTAMAKGIVAFEVSVEELQYKEKLSQNKQENERHNIINAFKESSIENEREIANYMRNKEE